MSDTITIKKELAINIISAHAVNDSTYMKIINRSLKRWGFDRPMDIKELHQCLLVLADNRIEYLLLQIN